MKISQEISKHPKRFIRVRKISSVFNLCWCIWLEVGLTLVDPLSHPCNIFRPAISPLHLRLRGFVRAAPFHPPTQLQHFRFHTTEERHLFKKKDTNYVFLPSMQYWRFSNFLILRFNTRQLHFVLFFVVFLFLVSHRDVLAVKEPFINLLERLASSF